MSLYKAFPPHLPVTSGDAFFIHSLPFPLILFKPSTPPLPPKVLICSGRVLSSLVSLWCIYNLQGFFSQKQLSFQDVNGHPHLHSLSIQLVFLLGLNSATQPRTVSCLLFVVMVTRSQTPSDSLISVGLFYTPGIKMATSYLSDRSCQSVSTECPPAAVRHKRPTKIRVQSSTWCRGWHPFGSWS